MSAFPYSAFPLFSSAAKNRLFKLMTIYFVKGEIIPHGIKAFSDLRAPFTGDFIYTKG